MGRWVRTARACRDCRRRFVATTAEYCPKCRRAHVPAPPPAKRLYVWNDAKDALVREIYDKRKGCVVRIAQILGFSTKSVSLRAAALGLTSCPPRRPWTRKEIAFLEENVGRLSVLTIAHYLGRGANSVQLKINRLGFNARVREGYSMRELAEAFGCDHHKVRRWAAAGWLGVVKRVHGGSAPAFAADRWTVDDEQVRNFIIEHRDAFRLERVDQTWFLDLVLPKASPVSKRKKAA